MMRAPDHKTSANAAINFALFSARTGSAPACEEKAKTGMAAMRNMAADRLFHFFKTSGFHHQFHLRHSDTFLASSAETLIPEIPCRALKSTFSISIVTFFLRVGIGIG